MRWMRRLDAWSGLGARYLALTGIAGLLVLALATVTDVLLRWILKRPIAAVSDLAPLITAVAIATCFPSGVAERQNVTITYVGSTLGRLWHRALDVLGGVLTAAFFIMMTRQYVLFSAEMGRAGERTIMLRAPVAYWWWAVTGLIAICAAVAVIVLVADAAGARGAEEARGSSDGAEVGGGR